MRHSGAIRMGLLLGVAVASLLVAVVGLLGYRTNQEVLGIFDRSLDSSRQIAIDNMSRLARLLASNTAVTVRPSVLDHNYSYIRSVLDDMSRRDANLLYIGVVDADGSVIEEAGDRALGARLRDERREGLLIAEDPVMAATTEIVSQDRSIGSLTLGYSMRPVGESIEEAQQQSRRERSNTIRNLVVGGGVVLVLGIVMAAGFGMWLSRPVSRMAQAASRLGGGRFDVRVDVGGPHEIRQLAVTFNAMAGALQESVRASNEQAALEREVAIARRLQKEMMPPESTLRVGKLEIASWYEPAGQVGGDWWTVIADDAGSTGTTVMIGDVIGHGVPAALFTAAARGAYRAASMLGAAEPDQILGTIDRVLRGFAGPHTMSCCAARIGDGEVRLAIAGHPPPVRFRGAASPAEMAILDAGGPLLGETGAPAPYAAVDYALEPGDLIVLFTDGLIEACNPADRMFGLRRLQSAVQDGIDRPLDDILGGVRSRLEDHVAGREIDDDITVVLVRYS